MHNGSGDHAQFRRSACTTRAVCMLNRARRIHNFYLLFIFAVSPACQSSFVFDVGLTTGFVEIGLSLTTMILYTINGVMSIRRMHQKWCKLLCKFYIDFGVIL